MPVEFAPGRIALGIAGAGEPRCNELTDAVPWRTLIHMSDSLPPRPTREAEQLPVSLPPAAPPNPPPPAGDSDDELMARVANKDEDAFQALYLRHAHALQVFLEARSPSPAVADDFFQEVWLKVFTRAAQYRPGNFRAWLFQIARFDVITAFRKNKKFLAGGSEAVLDAIAGERGDAGLENVIRVEEADILAGCLERLDERALHVVRARCDGVPYDEIARHLENKHNVGALTQVFHAAVKKLRECVTSRIGEGEERP